jgi:hypothetical protein
VGKGGQERVLALVVAGYPEKVVGGRHGQRQGVKSCGGRQRGTIVVAVIPGAGRRFLRRACSYRHCGAEEGEREDGDVPEWQIDDGNMPAGGREDALVSSIEHALSRGCMLVKLRQPPHVGELRYQGDKLAAPCSPAPHAHECLQWPPDVEKGRLSVSYKGGEGQRTRMPVDEQNKRGGVGGGGGLQRTGGGGGRGGRQMGMSTRG